jgi:signal transduction histidine kinase
MRLVRTLRGRLVVIAMVWCGLFLFATGFSLQTMMRNYWQEAEADGLRLQLYDLLSRLEIQPDGMPVVTEPMADPVIASPTPATTGSWSWGDGGQPLPLPVGCPSERPRPEVGLRRSGSLRRQGAQQGALLIMTRTVLLPGSDRVFTLVMAKDSSALTQTLKKTRISLFLGLGFAATGLVLGFMFQIVYGLRPLHLLRRELSRVHQGHQEGFRLRYPLEIQPLVEDINRLLHHYGELLQRARSHTGNLAHALKTPLSIMRNQVAQLPPEDQAALGEQLDQIQRHIDYHLGKARVTGAAKILGVSTPVRARVEYICRAFSRLYPGKKWTCRCRSPWRSGWRSRTSTRWWATCWRTPSSGPPAAAHLQRRAGGWITLRIEDDGPGMSEDQIAKAVLRGAPRREGAGFGLGLNIVSDLAEAYRGSLIMGRAELGGLAASLSLPKVARVESLSHKIWHLF